MVIKLQAKSVDIGENVDLTNVTYVYREAKAHLANSKEISINLSKLKTFDSAILTLLLSFKRLAQKQNKTFVCQNCSSSLKDFLSEAGVDQLLEEKK